MRDVSPNATASSQLKKNVTTATVIILLMNLTSRVLGFLREMVIARVFGATMYTDAYLIAYTLPYSAQQIVGWAIVSVTVPVITKHIVEGDRTAADLAGNYFINTTAWLMLLVSALGVLAAPLLVKISAPSLDAATADLAVRMTRIMFPSVFFVCIGMVFTGILNAHRRFAIAAFAPALSNLIIILAVCFAGSVWGIWGLAVGTLVSFIFFLLVQIPSAIAAGWRYRPCLPHHDEEIRLALSSLIPIILGMSVNQIYYILNRFFASGLAEGSISALNYGAKLAQFPVGVFVSAVAVAIYPLLTEYAICKDLKQFRNTLERGLGIVLLLTAPAAAGLFVLRVPIIRILFEHGAFTAADTANAASALLFYAIGLVAYALIMVLLRVFFAFSDVKTPVIAGIAGIAANIVVSLVTLDWMGHNGLALATTMASIVNMMVFFLFLRKHLPDMNFGPMVISSAKILISTVIMAVAVAFYMRAAAGLGDAGIILGGIFIGIVVYLLSAVFLRIREWLWLKEMIWKKIGREIRR